MAVKYTAYLGCYTRQNKDGGIQIFDVDVPAGRLIPRENGTVKINNASYIAVSHDGRFLYSICDEGVSAFTILPDGGLEMINTLSINGMRGCHIALTRANDYLVVSGYHDGKVTVIRLNPSGALDCITEEIYHNGLGMFADRSNSPHVECCVFSPDEEYLCACDSGIDQIKIYKFNHESGRLKLVDIIRTQLDSAPRQIVFSADGKYAYVVCENKNLIDVFSYKKEGSKVSVTPVQTIFTVRSSHKDNNAPYDFIFTPDGKNAICSNAGSNTVTIYNVNKERGTLSILSSLPISGRFPKYLCLFPDNRHLLSMNAEENTITDFTIHYNKGTIIMNGAPIKVMSPNNLVMLKTETPDA
ncbi:MAG: lactonase family protein [Lachnospiraceae bacterium]|jgi:6-phosphogluconolactonase